MIRAATLWELARFYQAAVLNTIFGLGLFALLIRGGVPLFTAQAIAFAGGVAFNYVTYSRHTFRGGTRRPARFAVAYGVNYLVNVAALWALHAAIASPYLAALATTVVGSLVNYAVLRRWVFSAR